MRKKNNDRDTENTNSVENNANIRGSDNTTKQAGRDIIEGGSHPDEGRVKNDPFTIFSDLSRSLAELLFKLGVGDRLERLSYPMAALLAIFFLPIGGDTAQDFFEPTGAAETALNAAAYVYTQISAPLIEFLTGRWEIAVPLVLLVVLPIWYKMTKLDSTCDECGQHFAVVWRTIEYPSRSTVDAEGNRHIPVSRERYCVYCDGDVEPDGSNRDGDESAPQVLADGGDGGDAGGCCCSCHNED